MYKNSCGFVCEDFPQENQTLQTRNDLWLNTKPQLFLYGVVWRYLFGESNSATPTLKIIIINSHFLL